LARDGICPQAVQRREGESDSGLPEVYGGGETTRETVGSGWGRTDSKSRGLVAGTFSERFKEGSQTRCAHFGRRRFRPGYFEGRGQKSAAAAETWGEEKID